MGNKIITIKESQLIDIARKSLDNVKSQKAKEIFSDVLRGYIEANRSVMRDGGTRVYNTENGWRFEDRRFNQICDSNVIYFETPNGEKGKFMFRGEDENVSESKLGRILGGAALTASLLGAPSCSPYNEPELPTNKEQTEVVYKPHEYPVGDNAGQSATAFKNFYDKCDWSKCGNGDGYIYRFVSSGCGKENKSRAWYVNVAKKGKKDGFYQYAMFLPADAYNGTFEVGDLITEEYLKKNCQLQVIFTVNCMTEDGEIVVDNQSEGNCPYSNTTKFYNKYDDWKVGMSRVYDKWIDRDYTYHFQLIECIALEGKTYKVVNVTVDKETYKYFDKGDIYQD